MDKEHLDSRAVNSRRWWSCGLLEEEDHLPLTMTGNDVEYG